MAGLQQGNMGKKRALTCAPSFPPGLDHML